MGHQRTSGIPEAHQRRGQLAGPVILHRLLQAAEKCKLLDLATSPDRAAEPLRHGCEAQHVCPSVPRDCKSQCVVVAVAEWPWRFSADFRLHSVHSTTSSCTTLGSKGSQGSCYTGYTTCSCCTRPTRLGVQLLGLQLGQLGVQLQFLGLLHSPHMAGAAWQGSTTSTGPSGVTAQ